MRAGGRRGAALLVCLLVLAALAAASAAALWLARTELWAAGNARAARQALYSAEAGIYHAVALIAPGRGFGALIERDGGLADPARPGPLPFPGGGWVAFPGPPFGYAVDVLPAPSFPDGGPRLVLVSRATAVRGARHAVRAVIGRALRPYAPAALVVASGRVRVLPGGPPDGPLIRGGLAAPAQAAAALGAATAGAVEVARRAIAAAGGRIVGDRAGLEVRRIDVGRLAAESGLPVVPAGRLAALRASAPSARRVDGGETARLAGSGVVLVEGDLTVAGEIRFEGVLLAAGRLRLAGTPCRIAGLVWAEEVEIGGSCTVSYDAAAISAADRLVPLPRLPVVLALDDVSGAP